VADRPAAPRVEDEMRRIFVIAALVAAAHTVQSQSLGDAAAKEKERRAKIDKPSKTFTESDLQDAADKRAKEGSPSSEASPSPPAGQARPTPTSSSPRPPASPDAATSEEARKARASELRARMAETLASLKQAEAELKAAQENWTMVSDNPYVVNRARWVDVERSIKMARSQLDAAQSRVDTLRRTRDDIDDTARREGIPQQMYLP
jgi:hypothetical protein